MKINPISSDQLQELFELYDEYNRPRDQHPDIEEANNILAQIRRQDAEIFVAVDPSILGTYMIHICHNLTRSGRPYAIVENVICKSTIRRSGVGRQLMEHAIEYAQSKGCYKLALQTGIARTENHQFYEACGLASDKRAYQIRFK